MRPDQGTIDTQHWHRLKTSLEILHNISPKFSTPSSPISLYKDIATLLILQPAMSLDKKLTQTLAAMERMEKLMEALNNDLEAIKQENHYLKAVVETNNDPTHPDHPLYEEPAVGSSPPPANYPQSTPGKSEIKYHESKMICDAAVQWFMTNVSVTSAWLNTTT